MDWPYHGIPEETGRMFVKACFLRLAKIDAGFARISQPTDEDYNQYLTSPKTLYFIVEALFKNKISPSETLHAIKPWAETDNSVLDVVEFFFTNIRKLMVDDENDTITTMEVRASLILCLELAVDEYLIQFLMSHDADNIWEQTPLALKGVTFYMVRQRLDELRKLVNFWRFLVCRDINDTIAFCQLLLYIVHVDPRFGCNCTGKSDTDLGFEDLDIENLLGQSFTKWLLYSNDPAMNWHNRMQQQKEYYDTKLYQSSLEYKAVLQQLTQKQMENATLWNEVANANNRLQGLELIVLKMQRSVNRYFEVAAYLDKTILNISSEPLLNQMAFKALTDNYKLMVHSFKDVMLELESYEFQFGIINQRS